MSVPVSSARTARQIALTAAVLSCVGVPRMAAAQRPADSVFVLMLDGTRPDSLRAAHTPNLDRLGGEGTDQMVSVPDAVKARYENAFGDLHPRVIFVDHGFPGKEILRKAHGEHIDLVVLSTHGHDTLGDRLLGSNAEHIACHAPCPVLIV